MNLSALELKPDLADSLQRFEAWWVNETLDRPPVTVRVQPVRPYDGPIREHASHRDRWLDAEYQVDRAIAEVLRYEYPADSVPYVRPGVGPELSSTPLGAELEFGETTSWSKPWVASAEQWSDVATRRPDFHNPYWQKIEEMTRLILDKCNHRFAVGVADLHGNYDLLAGLRDPELLCMDLIDRPELVDAAAKRASSVFVQCFQRHEGMIRDGGAIPTSFITALHDGPTYLASCDFWCMLGPDHARRFVLPRIVEETRPLERCIFHLDGPQALRHLDLILGLDELHAVQWVYGAGNGPASRWIEVYRRIRNAGKAIQVLAQTPRDALDVLDAVGKRGLWLDITAPFDDATAARAFVDEVARSP